MATIRPFKSIRPYSDKAAEVAALPYDVYNREEARAAVQGKPNSFLRVDRPETTMAEDVDIYDASVYQQAVKNLQALFDNESVFQEDKPCYYLYELVMDGRSQTGLVACTSVDEYINGKIKKHELTREDKEQDRIHHVDACDANTGPIFLTYRNQAVINQIVERIKAEQSPEYDFTADDGIIHRVWVIDDTSVIDALTAAFAEIDALYIADGHHRSASAVKVGLKRREEHPDYTGDEEFNYFLSVIFPDDQLAIMDYNRVVKDLNGLDSTAFLDAVSEAFTVEKIGKENYKPQAHGTFGMVLDGEWYKLTIKPEFANADDVVGRLDVSVLQKNLLTPILGIGDPRTDKRIDFIGGIRGLDELVRRTQKDMKVGFALYPTSLDELMAIADAGLLMPPKSTWFEPKLRSGLFIHALS